MSRYDLDRFVNMQIGSIDKAVKDILRGEGNINWLNYTFPKLQGLAKTEEEKQYGIVSFNEAHEYLQNSFLRQNFYKLLNALIESKRLLKDFMNEEQLCHIHSSLTLFYIVSDIKTTSLIDKVICMHFRKELNRETIKILGKN